MKKTALQLTACLALLLTASAFGQTQPAAATPAPTPPPPTLYQQLKNPTKWLSLGADLRARNEYVNNAKTLNDDAARHEQDYFRFRTRIWTALTPIKDVSLNARFVAEPREWMKDSDSGQFGPRVGNEEKYALIDQLNVKWNNIGNQPVSLTCGRQEIMLGDPGDWWLVQDGTPSDGSWTFFFDSVRLNYEVKDIKTKFDAVFLYQNALPDEWIPTLGRSSDNWAYSAPAQSADNPNVYTNKPAVRKPYTLTDQNEYGAILYASTKAIKDMQIDAYFIYKGDHMSDYQTHTNLIKSGDNADIYTIGAKVTGTPATHLSYSIEGAYQFGSKQDSNVYGNTIQVAKYPTDRSERRNISAYGGKFRVSYLFKDKLNNQVNLVGEYLSGDDPKSKGTDEMFDILWGRYPRWSELGVFYYGSETAGRACQMNNLGRIGVSYSMTPVKGMNFNAMYNALFAPQSTPTRDATGTSASNPERFSYDGNFRGHFVQTGLSHQFNKNVSAAVKAELLWMGDYYISRDLMTFVRAELMFTF